MSNVYCKDCISYKNYYKPECHCESNMELKVTPLESYLVPIRKPKKINKNNDCMWYELKPEPEPNMIKLYRMTLFIKKDRTPFNNNIVIDDVVRTKYIPVSNGHEDYKIHIYTNNKMVYAYYLDDFYGIESELTGEIEETI